MELLIVTLIIITLVGALNILSKLGKSENHNGFIPIDKNNNSVNDNSTSIDEDQNSFFTGEDEIYHNNNDFWDDAMVNPANPLYHLFHPDYPDSGHDDWNND